MRTYKALISGVALAALGSLVPMAAAQDATAGQAAGDGPSEAEVTARMAAVQRHVDAYRSGNLDRFVATFTPDAEVYANGMVARGRSEIRALYSLNFAPDAPKLSIHDSGISGDFVYLSAGYILPGGEEVCCSYSEYEVRDGKISYISSSM